MLSVAEIPRDVFLTERRGDERKDKNGIGNEQTSISAAFEKGF